ncbi:MAG: WD40 repeat domain-containing serine/threonine protein kinase [Blastocatellia bacterium]
MKAMNSEPERRDKIIQLCDKALDLDPGERAAFLDAACEDDERLRQEVESLLKHEETARDFLAQPVWERFAGRVAGQEESLEGRELGRYRIRERLGAGGMGEVWKAWDGQLKREVAIKILPLEFSSDTDRVRRFEQEALTVSALNHPNIITIHEVGRIGELHFIVTEFIEGQTLRDYLLGMRESRVPGWRETVLITTQIAGALSAAHTAGITHRDIKPENVMAQGGGLVKVLDFGIAKRVGAVVADGDGQPAAGIDTRIGVRAGTLKYMSPEQARGELLDARTDIFSLGLVFYEMIAGRHPYSGKSDVEVIDALKNEDEIPPVSGVNGRIPAELDHIVAKALRKNRDDRYSSAEEMLAEIKQLESLIEVSPDEKHQWTFKARSANQLLTQFAVFYDSDEKTRMPLSGLWTIWRFADLKRGNLERELTRKSLVSALLSAWWKIVLIAAITMLAAAWISVNETWDERILRDGHTAAVRRAVFSPDGRLLVSVGEDKQVIVWDFKRRERLKTFNDHTDWITSVAFSPDGKWFATASYDRTVIVWDAARLEKAAV